MGVLYQRVKLLHIANEDGSWFGQQAFDAAVTGEQEGGRTLLVTMAGASKPLRVTVIANQPGDAAIGITDANGSFQPGKRWIVRVQRLKDPPPGRPLTPVMPMASPASPQHADPPTSAQPSLPLTPPTHHPSPPPTPLAAQLLGGAAPQTSTTSRTKTASASSTVTPPAAGGWAALKVAELRRRATDARIPGAGRMTRAELLAALGGGGGAP